MDNFIKKGTGLLLSFTIFFESTASSWAMERPSEEEKSSSQSSLRSSAEYNMTDTQREKEINDYLEDSSEPGSLSKDEKEHLFIEEITKCLKEIKGEFPLNTSSEKRPLIMLLGNTRAGKSTIAKWLTGERLYCVRNLSLEEEDRNNHFQFIFSNTPKDVNPGLESETTKPQIYSAGDILLADCAGLNDNRGILQQIKNALYIQALLEYRGPKKFLLVIPAEDFSDNSIKNAFINLLSTLKFLSGAEDSVALTVSRYRPMDPSIRSIKSKMETLSKLENIEKINSELLRHLIERVALFPHPSKVITERNTPPIDVTEQFETDKSNLLQIITNTDTLENSDMQVIPPLSDKVRLTLDLLPKK